MKTNVGLCLLLLHGLLVCPMATVAAEEQISHEERIGWWREARFGMFIHWGLYSILGGDWQGKDYGKETGGHSAEWILHDAEIPIEQYKPLAGQFNPVRFDAHQWVSLAREAGMKYMVITAKHHDGFCLFDTRQTDFDIMDASPFKRDIIKELADECHSQGLRFGVYYSHRYDWTARPVMNDSDYFDMVRGHVRELLSNYGDISIMWFDMGTQAEREQNDSYAAITRELQPKSLISGRLRGSKGTNDYRQEGDRTIPSSNAKSDAETPMTFRDNWGYDKDENNWKSNEDMLQRFVLCVCRGANMLLNVGPKPDGTLCEEEVQGFKAIGRWMKVNSEAIYGTQQSPFRYDFPWGSMTRKGKENRLYLHVLNWKADGILFDNFKTKVSRAWLLADPSKSLQVEQDLDKGTVRVRGPVTAPDPIVTVIALEVDGDIEVIPAKRPYFWHKGKGIKLEASAPEEDQKKASKEEEKLDAARTKAHEFYEKLNLGQQASR